MTFSTETIECQNPVDIWNINRTYTVVKCIFDNTDNATKEYMHNRALALSLRVNPNEANNADNPRGHDRLVRDSLGGILAEEGWIEHINSCYGGIATATNFVGANGQIDIQLNNGNTIEVRSSFPRRGVKFATCNGKYNFRNICTYSNLYKSDEKPKDFFASVLFETQKDNLLNATEIVFYLIGGSTRDMMLSDLSYTADLKAEDDPTQTFTKYQVIDLKNVLDISGFHDFMASLQYKLL